MIELPELHPLATGIQEFLYIFLSTNIQYATLSVWDYAGKYIEFSEGTHLQGK